MIILVCMCLLSSVRSKVMRLFFFYFVRFGIFSLGFGKVNWVFVYLMF